MTAGRFGFRVSRQLPVSITGMKLRARLIELVQRLQGNAVDFVFDEIPSEIIGNFQSLVHELSLIFQSGKTNKTFRVQFGKRAQRLGESVEDYSAELKASM